MEVQAKIKPRQLKIRIVNAFGYNMAGANIIILQTIGIFSIILVNMGCMDSRYDSMKERLLFGTPPEKAAAFEEFGQLGPEDKEAIPVIIDIMRNPKYSENAGMWLMQIGDSASEIIPKLLSSPDVNLRIGGLIAFQGIEKLHNGSTAGKVVKLCYDKEPSVRINALSCLWLIKDKEHESSINNVIKMGIIDSNENVVRATLGSIALMHWRMRWILEDLISMMEKESQNIRQPLLDAIFYINAGKDKDLALKIIEEAKRNGYSEIIDAGDKIEIKEK